MKLWRILVGSAVGIALTATLAVTPAGAAPAPTSKPGVEHVYVAPPAPKGASVSGSFKTLASPPSVSPSVAVQTAPPGGTYTCASGTLCTLIYYPDNGLYYIFKLYYCNTYSLSNWNNINGWYKNNQTTNTRSDFYDVNMNSVTTIYAPSNLTSYDWRPIWYIKNC